MMAVMDELVALVATLNERGIPATLDPRDVQIPGAIVELARVGSGNMLCGDTTAAATVYLIAPDNGRELATSELLAMYNKCADLILGAEPIDLALPDTAPLPALKTDPIDLT